VREPSRLWELGDRLVAHGVVAWCPTIVSSPPERVTATLAALHARPDNYRGAAPFGLHLEGPMLNPLRRGAHDRRHLVAPSSAVIEGWSRRDGVAMVTLAPELPGALDVVGALVDRDVLVSMGHTDATTAQAEAGVDNGVRASTHLCNAMAPFAHREPGPIGVALADERVTSGLIVDGIHLHPRTVAALWRALGPQRTYLVTDAVAALGMPFGPQHLGDTLVTVDATGVRLADGTLAGSNLAMDQAVRNLVEFTGCTIVDALTTVTLTPGTLIGREPGLAVGASADLVLLDAELRVVATIVHGVLLHSTIGTARRG